MNNVYKEIISSLDDKVAIYHESHKLCFLSNVPPPRAFRTKQFGMSCENTPTLRAKASIMFEHVREFTGRNLIQQYAFICDAAIFVW